MKVAGWAHSYTQVRAALHAWAPTFPMDSWRPEDEEAMAAALTAPDARTGLLEWFPHLKGRGHTFTAGDVARMTAARTAAGVTDKEAAK